MAKIISTDKARQGSRGTHVLMILVSALLLVAVVWAGLELYGNAIAPDNSSEAGGATQPVSPPAQP